MFKLKVLYDDVTFVCNRSLKQLTQKKLTFLMQNYFGFFKEEIKITFLYRLCIGTMNKPQPISYLDMCKAPGSPKKKMYQKKSRPQNSHQALKN